MDHVDTLRAAGCVFAEDEARVLTDAAHDAAHLDRLVGGRRPAAAEGSIELHSTDIDPVAVRCPRRNVGRVHQGDLFEPLPSLLLGRVDLVTVNAPYVPSDELELLPREARLYEPRSALDGGADGLDVLRRAVAAAPRWLAPEDASWLGRARLSCRGSRRPPPKRGSRSAW